MLSAQPPHDDVGEALEAAKAAVRASADVQSCEPQLRALAHALGATRPQRSTLLALLAVLDKQVHAGKFIRDQDAWEAHGAKERNFRSWKNKIQDMLTDAVDQLPGNDLSGMDFAFVGAMVAEPVDPFEEEERTPSEPTTAEVNVVERAYFAGCAVEVDTSATIRPPARGGAHALMAMVSRPTVQEYSCDLCR